ncbi:unnamed protein product [Arabis nemorensis]|uniref:Uncharacterized protein n=1 Tax=Arabis nemorensis TaxID=586526 RepID=A0A565CVH9_9BRAS|nr:unnamed protein product [Arabis nemorensis]
MADNDYAVNVMTNFIAGVMAAPVCLTIQYTAKLKQNWWLPWVLFAGTFLGTLLTKFMETNLKNMGFWACVKESASSGGYFVLGGALPMILGSMIPNVGGDHWVRILVAIVISILEVVVAIAIFQNEELGSPRETKFSVWWVLACVMIGSAVFTGLADALD